MFKLQAEGLKRALEIQQQMVAKQDELIQLLKSAAEKAIGRSVILQQQLEESEQKRRNIEAVLLRKKMEEENDRLNTNEQLKIEMANYLKELENP